MRYFILMMLCLPGCAPDVDRFKDPVDAGVMDMVNHSDAQQGNHMDAEPGQASDMSVPSTCTVKFQVVLPANTPADARLHIAGDFYGGEREWQADDATLALQRNSEGAAIELALEHQQTVQYKYTLGSWESVELAQPDCRERTNREWVVDCGETTPEVLDEVDAWTGLCP